MSSGRRGFYILIIIINNVRDANIYTRNPCIKCDDGAQLTEQGVRFAQAMQQKGLIEDWD